MQWSDVQFNPPARMLRQFSALWIVVLGGLAAWHGLRHHETTPGLVLAALAVAGSIGLVAPAVMRPVFVVMTVVGFPIGWVVSRVALLLLFVVVITPIALLFRLRGRDLLALRRREQPTYWTAKPKAPDAASYFRQY